MDGNIKLQTVTYGASATTTGTRMFPGMKVKVDGGTVETKSDSVSITIPGSTAPAQADEVFSDNSQAVKYSSLSPEQKAAYKDAIMTLNKNARLFVSDNSGLRRAAPVEVKNALDNGREVFVVTGLASEAESRSSYSREMSNTQGFLNFHDYKFASYSSNGSDGYVYYSASPLSCWDDLDFADLDGKGVPGTSRLPASGGRAHISSEWESNWQRETSKTHGIFRIHDDSSVEGGSERVSRG